MNLKNKTILITGGSSGFGFELAKEFLKKEAKVIICSNNLENLKKAEKKLKSKNLTIKKCDVRNYSEITALVAEIKTVDILVNCAGLYAKDVLQNFDAEIIANILDVNLKGLIYFTKAVLPKMLKRNKGVIMNVGSLTGIHGKANQTIYAASKFGVRGFTESLADELAETKIKIVEIYPGPMITPIYKKAGITKVNYRRMDPRTVAQLTVFSVVNMQMNYINNIVINGLRENFTALK